MGEPPGQPKASIAQKPDAGLAGIGRRSPERSGGGSIELLGGGNIRVQNIGKELDYKIFLPEPSQGSHKGDDHRKE